jgi:hypothetical protein
MLFFNVRQKTAARTSVHAVAANGITSACPNAAQVPLRFFIAEKFRASLSKSYGLSGGVLGCQLALPRKKNAFWQQDRPPAIMQSPEMQSPRPALPRQART